jgi:biotin-dependent carboxylase-like uncharacterized protein
VIARSPAIELLDGGPQTTVQDLGRPGYLRYGIPPSGPIDRWAFILANRLAGNSDGAAALECTLIGPRLQARREGVIAVTGAEMPVTINGQEAPRWTALPVKPGDVVKLGPARRGVRAYLAVAGGIDVPLVLGSRSTYPRGRLGGHEGRALRRGDLLSVFPPAFPLDRLQGRTVRPQAIPDYSGEPFVRVILGPQADRFTAEGIRALLTGPYEMTSHSDRMGARLTGPLVKHSSGHDIVSDGIALGGIQVVGEGQPIVLLVDRQSAGGYTKVATVCSFDIGVIGQVKPGQKLRFKEVSVAEAHAILREEQERLARAIDDGHAGGR